MNYSDTPFNTLCAFLRGEADGSAMEDVTYRAYDLDRMTGMNTLKKACAVLGRNSASELTDDLACIGLLPDGGAQGPVCRWFVWYRLCRGELSKWPLR